MTPDDALHPAPVFSLEERDRRYAFVRKKMREAGLAALICPHATGEWDNFQPATRYLSCVGGAGMATALIFPLEGSPIAAIRDARRVDRARSGQRWVADVRAPPNNNWAEFFAEGLRELGVNSETVGVVGLDSVVREPSGTHRIQRIRRSAGGTAERAVCVRNRYCRRGPEAQKC